MASDPNVLLISDSSYMDSQSLTQLQLLQTKRSVRHAWRKLQLSSIAVAASALLLPVLTYFAGPGYWPLGLGCVFAVAQCLLGTAGYFSVRGHRDVRLKYFRRAIHIYFLTFLGFLLVYQVVGLILVASHNQDNCTDFDLNRVCKKRSGLMTWQVNLLMLLPLADFFVYIVYQSMLRLVSNCTVSDNPLA